MHRCHQRLPPSPEEAPLHLSKNYNTNMCSLKLNQGAGMMAFYKSCYTNMSTREPSAMQAKQTLMNRKNVLP